MKIACKFSRKIFLNPIIKSNVIVVFIGLYNLKSDTYMLLRGLYSRGEPIYLVHKHVCSSTKNTLLIFIKWISSFLFIFILLYFIRSRLITWTVCIRSSQCLDHENPSCFLEKLHHFWIGRSLNRIPSSLHPILALNHLR